jgi:hypothetical protein
LGEVTLFSFNGQSSFNDLEVEAQKRYNNGLTITSSFTWSKNLDDLTPIDMWYGSSWKEVSLLNIGKRFSFASVYELPYGRGRRFGANSPTVVNALLAGWQLSALMEIRSGYPLNLTDSGNIANTGGITQVPDVIGNGNLPPGQQTRNAYFNTAAFAAPAAYTLGDFQPYSIVGPSFQNLDSSLSKTFPLKERMALQFRSEYFNVLNHPNWGNPGTTLGTASFGRITSNISTPRTLQFALKFLF